MKKVQSFGLVLVFVLAILMPGCQESTAKEGQDTPDLQTEKQQIESAAKPKAQIKEEAKSAPAASAKGPKILVTKEFHDFGDIGPASNHTCEFNFQNVGSEMLVIEKVQSTCGCSVPQLKKNDYAPGESGTVEVRFHSPSNKGETKKQLYILSNDPSRLHCIMHFTERISHLLPS